SAFRNPSSSIGSPLGHRRDDGGAGALAGDRRDLEAPAEELEPLADAVEPEPAPLPVRPHRRRDLEPAALVLDRDHAAAVGPGEADARLRDAGVLDGVEDELADELEEQDADVAGGHAAGGLRLDVDVEPVEPAHVVGEPAERLLELLGLERRRREVHGELARGLERLLEDPVHLVDEPPPLGALGPVEEADVEAGAEEELLDVVV